jgi:nitrite reductase/ring-hydroxylating ferredoxin subunit
MSLLRLIFGICITQLPEDEDCWRYSRGRIKIEWARAPELYKPGGAIRLEGKGLPIRVLVVYGMDGQYHAFRNRSTFMGRRLDPVAGTQTICSCNVLKSVFDYTGNVMSGPAKEPLKTFQVETKQCKVIVWL